MVLFGGYFGSPYFCQTYFGEILPHTTTQSVFVIVGETTCQGNKKLLKDLLMANQSIANLLLITPVDPTPDVFVDTFSQKGTCCKKELEKIDEMITYLKTLG